MLFHNTVSLLQAVKGTTALFLLAGRLFWLPLPDACYERGGDGIFIQIHGMVYKCVATL